METVNVTTAEGVTFECFPDSIFMLDEIWKDGIYDIPDLASFKDLRVLDIGANQGFFSIYAARQGARVFCYEPDPANFEVLSRNVTRSGLGDRVTIRKAAVAEKDGEVEIFRSTHTEVCSSATISTSRSFFEKNRDSIFKSFVHSTIEAVSLDNALLLAGSPIDLIKMDCEGAELEILKGASRKTLQSIHRIAMETHPGYRQKELVDILEGSGFSVVEYQKPSGPMQTGFIKAARLGRGRRGVVRVVSKILKVGGNQSTLSGESSFSIGIPDASLSFEWSEASVPETISTAPTISPGRDILAPRRFKLRVSAGDQYDIDEAIWSPPRDLADTAIALGPREIKHQVTIASKTRFRIPKELFPTTWSFSNIVVQISSLDARPLQGSISISGSEKVLEEWYSEFGLPGHPEDTDAIFDLTVAECRSLAITWWAEG